MHKCYCNKFCCQHLCKGLRCFPDLEHVLKSIELEEYRGKEENSHKPRAYFNIVLDIL